MKAVDIVCRWQGWESVSQQARALPAHDNQPSWTLVNHSRNRLKEDILTDMHSLKHLAD